MIVTAHGRDPTTGRNLCNLRNLWINFDFILHPFVPFAVMRFVCVDLRLVYLRFSQIRVDSCFVFSCPAEPAIQTDSP